ncbi:hypothetical protein [Dactylosporangium sp. CA-092794]|uniref:hypothetical protein n=1 Tax=Dactylosporangium sp. CA-092794 TaxID=3239929 RepID=UPI003D8E9CDD
MTRWLPALTVATAVVATLLAINTGISDILAYVAYAAVAVVMPGTLIYRALRQRPHSLVEDLAFGTAIGLIAETAVLALCRPALWAWPILVVIVLRRRLRPPDYPHRPTPAWSWAVAAVALGLVAYLAWAFLRVNQPVPVGAPQEYMIDQLNLLAVAADLAHHFPPAVPELGDRALNYHWFAYAHLAAANRLSGVDLPVLWFRLDLPALAVLAVVLLAVAAWRVTGRAWAGPVAAALMYTAGETVLPARAPAFFGTITAYYSWSSRSVLYASALTMPLIAVLAQVLRREHTTRTWLLLTVLAAGVAGAKSTVLPLALVGLACAGRRAWRAALVLLGVEALAVWLLYHFESQGLTWAPFGIMADFAHGRPAAIAAGLGAYAIAMGARLAGALVPPRRWGPVERLLAGAALAGLAGTVLVWHVSWGQHFFAIAGWPFGAILSADGLIRAHGRLRPRAVALAAVAVLPAVAFFASVPHVRRPWDAVYPTYLFGGLVLAAAGLVWLLARRRAGRAAALTVVLFAGGAGLPYDAVHHANLGTAYHVRVTPDQAAAARWLRAHSSPEDYVATNVHRVGSGEQAGQSLAYWISAYAERRVLLGSWGYSPESTRIQAGRRRAGPALDYWDPDRLAANDLAIYDPTRQRLARLWDQRVRWILVDRAQGRESPRLADLAPTAWSAGDVVVYRLRPPDQRAVQVSVAGAVLVPE